MVGISLLLTPVSAIASWPFFSSAHAAEPGNAPLVTDASLPLLDAPLNPDPAAGSSADPSISSGSALVATDGPDGALPAASDPTVAAANDGTISTYTVQSGDSISSIAAHFGVSVNTILWANGLTIRSTIKRGDTLVILPVSGVAYTVKRGDTLSSIASAFHADQGEIATFNGLDASATVVVGDKLIIPGGEVASTPPPSHTSSSSSSAASHAARTGSIAALESPTPTHSASGYFENPVPGAILTQGLHGNNAVDLGAPAGTPIHAAAAGTVIVSKGDGGWNGGWGSYVVVSHSNGSQTLYAHMSKDVSQVGEQVSQGEVLGYVGETGDATGNHLHLEVRGARNPFAYSCSVMQKCY